MINRDITTKIFDELFLNLTRNNSYKHVILHAETLDGSYTYRNIHGITSSSNSDFTYETPFNIASVTKIFIASIIMMLEEESIISINDKINMYLDSKIMDGLHTVSESEITIYNLLSHSSGIPDYIDIKNSDGKNLFDYIFENGDTSWSRLDFYDIVKKHNKPLFASQAIDAPKKKIKYSDTNYQLLMDIIEVVCGKSIAEVFEEKIYIPLKLNKTFHENSKISKRFSNRTSLWINNTEMVIPKSLESFNDIYSTSNDMIIFMRALLSGKLFKNPDTHRKMISNWNTFGFQAIPTSPGWPIQYSLGVMRFKYPKFLPPFKDIPEFYGHTGATGSWLFYCPKYDLIVTGDVGQLMASALPFRFMSKLILKLMKVSK